MSKQIHHWGISIAPTPYKGGTIYAELMPVGQPWWRRIWVGSWWFEVQSQEGHHYEYDGGAYTLREAIFKAMEAVDKASQNEDSGVR